MEQDDRHGQIWNDNELDVIIAGYFVMLDAELAKRPYVKSQHCAALMHQLGRSHRSVEFKHQNISAVLDELGLPWIPGYIPKENIQNAIFGGIERYLTMHPSVLEPETSIPVPIDPAEIFIAPPTRMIESQEEPSALRRLVRKFDPVARDYRNRTLGKAGEEFVVEVERRRLHAANRADLARQIRWVAFEDGDGAGYDVLSFSEKGMERLIEVKTTNGTARTPFFLSRNERQTSEERPVDWRIYRVHLFATSPRIFMIKHHS